MKAVLYGLAFLLGVLLYLGLGMALARGGDVGPGGPVLGVDQAAGSPRVKTAEDLAAVEAAGAAILEAAARSRPGPPVNPKVPQRPSAAAILGKAAPKPLASAVAAPGQAKGKPFKTPARNFLRRLFRR